MNEQELRERLNSLTGEIPAATHYAFLSAALPGKETTKMKKKISAGLVFALVLILVAAAAIAAGVLYDMKWWYGDQGRAQDPDAQMIMANRVAEPDQERTEDSLVDVAVQDVSWTPEEGRLVVTFRAFPKDPEHYELYSNWQLDVDGSYMGSNYVPEEGAEDDAPEEDEEDPDADEEEDGEGRNEHWLWRSEPEKTTGFGPVRKMMDDSSKHLLIIDEKGILLQDGTSMEGAGSLDVIRTPEGEVVYWLDFHPDWLKPSKDAEMKQFGEEYPNMKEYAEKKIAYAQNVREKLAGEGLNCVLHYRVVEYTDGMDDTELYEGGTTGQVEFALHAGN